MFNMQPMYVPKRHTVTLSRYTENYIQLNLYLTKSTVQNASGF